MNKHRCEDGLWIGKLKITSWFNGDLARLDYTHSPPLNSDESPSDRYILAILILGLTIRFDYCLSGRWCLVGWLEGQHLDKKDNYVG